MPVLEVRKTWEVGYVDGVDQLNRTVAELAILQELGAKIEVDF